MYKVEVYLTKVFQIFSRYTIQEIFYIFYAQMDKQVVERFQPELLKYVEYCIHLNKRYHNTLFTRMEKVLEYYTHVYMCINALMGNNTSLSIM